jgi:hypothetical protein
MALQMNEEIKTLQDQIASLELEMSKAAGQVEKLSELQLKLDDKYRKIMDNVLSVSKITALQEQRQRQLKRQVELCNHPCNPFSPANMPQPQPHPVQEPISVVKAAPTKGIRRKLPTPPVKKAAPTQFVNWDPVLYKDYPCTEV